jgi:hypothetical protein
MPQNSDNDDGDQSVPAAIKHEKNPDPIDPDITDPVIGKLTNEPDPK